jgi:ATP-binding cassette, subfamily C (CFTR/MRP), member 1
MSAKHSLVRACFRAYAGPFLAAVVPRLSLTAFTFCQPLMINSLITFIGDKDAPSANGRAMIGAYALVYLGMAASTSLYWYQTFRFLIRLRGGLISFIYKQTVRARAVDLGELNSVTLIGADVERIIVGLRSIHEIWGSLVDIAIAIYLLERQVYVACLVPGLLVLSKYRVLPFESAEDVLTACIVFVLATFQVSAWAKATQRVWVERVETRLAVTSSMLGDMRAVKMLGLRDKMFDIIHRLRQSEINGSSKFRKVLIVEIFLCKCAHTS